MLLIVINKHLLQLLFSGRAALVFLRFLHTLYYLLLITLNLKKINIELVVNIKCRVAWHKMVECDFNHTYQAWGCYHSSHSGNSCDGKTCPRHWVVPSSRPLCCRSGTFLSHPESVERWQPLSSEIMLYTFYRRDMSCSIRFTEQI